LNCFSGYTVDKGHTQVHVRIRSSNTVWEGRRFSVLFNTLWRRVPFEDYIIIRFVIVYLSKMLGRSCCCHCFYNQCFSIYAFEIFIQPFDGAKMRNNELIVHIDMVKYHT